MPSNSFKLGSVKLPTLKPLVFSCSHPACDCGNALCWERQLHPAGSAMLPPLFIIPFLLNVTYVDVTKPFFVRFLKFLIISLRVGSRSSHVTMLSARVKTSLPAERAVDGLYVAQRGHGPVVRGHRGPPGTDGNVLAITPAWLWVQWTKSSQAAKMCPWGWRKRRARGYCLPRLTLGVLPCAPQDPGPGEHLLLILEVPGFGQVSSEKMGMSWDKVEATLTLGPACPM